MLIYEMFDDDENMIFHIISRGDSYIQVNISSGLMDNNQHIEILNIFSEKMTRKYGTRKLIAYTYISMQLAL